MKRVILASILLVGNSALATRAPVSAFVNNTMTKGAAILAMKGDDSTKVGPLCALLKSSVSSATIASVWLGNYAGLARDKAGVAKFVKLIPSIIMTRALPALGGNGGGTFDVSEDAEDRGGDVSAVSVTVHAGNGNAYTGKVIVANIKGSFRIIDGEYLGFSAVNYTAGDFQKRFDAAYNADPSNSMPVSEVVKDLKSEDGFIGCP